MAKAFEAYAVGLIIRQKEPTNLETTLDQVDSYLTPTELFYIRSHFPAPKLERASYQLRIDGAVRKPLSLSDKQLRDMPSETKVAILECAGNSRVFLVPQVAGAQWERPGPDLHSLRRRVGGRDRGHGDRGEYRRRPDVGRGRIRRPHATVCLATLELRLADAQATGTMHPPRARQRR